jgi:hypothetical protein
MGSQPKPHHTYKSPEQLRQDLGEALQRLSNAIDLWEMGHQLESSTIATHVHALVADTHKHDSLLKQLGLIPKLAVSTPRWESYGTVTVRRLAHLKAAVWLGGRAPDVPLPTAGFAPLYYCFAGHPIYHMDDRPQWDEVSFKTWWTGESVLFNQGQPLTREQLVQALRNEVGVGHHAQQVRNRTLALIHGEFAGQSAPSLCVNGDKPVSFDGIAYRAVMRQIALELQTTLLRTLPRGTAEVRLVPPKRNFWVPGLNILEVHLDLQPLENAYRKLIAQGLEDRGVGLAAFSSVYWVKKVHELRRGTVGL